MESCGDEVFLTGWSPGLFLCFVKGKLSLRLITIKLKVSLIEVWLVVDSVLFVQPIGVITVSIHDLTA